MLEAFPEEIRHDILLRLPIECLVRCTSVSKPWLSIIKDTGFIRAHLRHRHEEPLILVHGRRYKSCECRETEEVYSLYRDNPAFDEYRQIDFPIDFWVDPTNVRVAGICDGLVCLADDVISKNLRYMIWNPSIRKAVTLPRPGFTFSSHGPFEDSVGFGFDATANDYKVVRLVTLETLEREGKKNPTVAEVYSIATGSWRSLGSVTPPCHIFGTRPQAFFNGTIHWIVNHWRKVANGIGRLYFILAFDIVSESFREILLPTGVKLSYNRYQVSVTGDGKYLALFTTYNDVHRINYLDIWVMKEYCQHESWTKITLAPQGPEGSVFRMAFCFRQNGEVLLDLQENCFCRTQTLVSLDPVSQRMNNVGILDRACDFFGSYEESLVLLNVDNAISC